MDIIHHKLTITISDINFTFIFQMSEYHLIFIFIWLKTITVLRILRPLLLANLLLERAHCYLGMFKDSLTPKNQLLGLIIDSRKSLLKDKIST